MILFRSGPRRSTAWVTGLVIAVAAMLPASGGCAARGRPTAEMVSLALHKQIDGCGESLQIQYSIHEDRADKPPFEKVRYVRTPQVIFIEFRRFDEQSHNETRVTRYLGDRVSKQGKMSEFHFDESHVFVHGQPSPITANSVMETAMICLTDETVPLYEGVRHGTVNKKPEMIDGHKCWRIDIRAETLVGESLRTAFRNCEFTVWVDPELGFCPRRLERVDHHVRGPDDEQSVSIRCEGYREAAKGIWFPTQQVAETTVTWNPAVSRTVSVLRDIQVGKPVPAKDIAIEFPEGLRPGDLDKGREPPAAIVPFQDGVQVSPLPGR
jgi:hypothetical protein